jgi:homoserine O-acetyltransferase/O-succinyltransferase
MKNLKHIVSPNWVLENGTVLSNVNLYYQTFGQPLGNSPVVLVNHALTGNSTVCGENGWWNDLIGVDKTIDTNFFTVLAVNIPGNGFDDNEENLIDNYKDFTIRDIAQIFWQALFLLKIEKLFAAIGGSLGGAIVWEMGVLQPDRIENLIPIAADWKATDWMIANVFLQENILNNSTNPIQDARTHAMLLYRTPQSINERFKREKNQEHSNYQIENWLINHGNKLQNRFKLASYRLMNHLLKTNDITRDRKSLIALTRDIKSNIQIIAVDSDLFFTKDENLETYRTVKESKQNVFYHEIKSNHGHDAFLIEFGQLSAILDPIFNKQKQQDYVKT